MTIKEKLNSLLEDSIYTINPPYNSVTELANAIISLFDNSVTHSMDEEEWEFFARAAGWSPEIEVRKLLWTNHPCGIHSLYGDDGEMQCGKCLIDFKGMPLEQIIQRVFAPVQSRLRVVEKCPHDLGTSFGRPLDGCEMCHGTGTVTRPLTQEEVNEVAEGHVEYHIKALGHEGITLKSGVKVVME